MLSCAYNACVRRRLSWTLSLPIRSLLEKDAVRIYTAVVFKKVRAQIRLIAGLEVISGTNQDGSSLYVFGLKDDNEVWDEVRVTFRGQSLEGVECHCRKMECEDIPCSHIFCCTHVPWY
jgi:hypothetical protein